MPEPGSPPGQEAMPTGGDVTAVVLTIGETTTGEAIASVHGQSAAPAHVLVVDGVIPFSRALNTAASQVRTPFFAQVDADMVLDPDCLAGLRAHMRPDVGVAVGPLDDPLVGRAQGVKMFRRDCFDTEQVPDSISPDTDFLARLERHGWHVHHLIELRGAHRRAPVFGRHRPALTPRAVYETYYLLGGRYRYLRDVSGLVWRMQHLRRRRHPVAPIALLAIGHGLFMRREDDVPKSHAPQCEVDFLERFLAGAGSCPGAERELNAARTLSPGAAVERGYALGSRLRAASAAGALRSCIRGLDATDDQRSWPAEVGLYHGLLCPSDTGELAARDRETFDALIERATGPSS